MSQAALEMHKHMRAMVDNWCPPGFEHEDFGVRLMRAFMNSTAYAADAKRLADGKQPIRPLNSYPNPLKNFPGEEQPAPRVKVNRVCAAGLEESSINCYAFDNMCCALGLKGGRLAQSVGNAILKGYEKTLDIDPVESNRVFRSKHTRWFMDNWSDKVKTVYRKNQSVLSDAQIEKIVVLVDEYLNHHPNTKSGALECALDPEG